MRAMIVDDEAPARSELRFLLEETGRVEEIAEASSAREAVEKLMEGRPDVLFLDISMPKTNGMQLAEALHKLKNPPSVVFVTAYSEYALEAFGVDAVDYLMKPVETDRLDRALDRIEERGKGQQQAPQPPAERIPVEKSGRKVLVPHGFFRVHRGYIVNLQYVEDVEVVASGVMQLGIAGVEGKKVAVSRRRVVQLKRALGL